VLSRRYGASRMNLDLQPGHTELLRQCAAVNATGRRPGLARRDLPGVAVSLPDGVDVSTTAAAVIVRLDLARLRSVRGKGLRELFVAAAVPTGRLN